MDKKRCRHHSFESILYVLMLCGLDTSDTRSLRSVVEQVYYLLLFNLPAKLQETKLFTFKTPFLVIQVKRSLL
jgi:hypothetical protein